MKIDRIKKILILFISSIILFSYQFFSNKLIEKYFIDYQEVDNNVDNKKNTGDKVYVKFIFAVIIIIFIIFAIFTIFYFLTDEEEDYEESHYIRAKKLNKINCTNNKFKLISNSISGLNKLEKKWLLFLKKKEFKRGDPIFYSEIENFFKEIKVSNENINKFYYYNLYKMIDPYYTHGKRLPCFKIKETKKERPGGITVTDRNVKFDYLFVNNFYKLLEDDFVNKMECFILKKRKGDKKIKPEDIIEYVINRSKCILRFNYYIDISAFRRSIDDPQTINTIANDIISKYANRFKLTEKEKAQKNLELDMFSEIRLLERNIRNTKENENLLNNINADQQQIYDNADLFYIQNRSILFEIEQKIFGITYKENVINDIVRLINSLFARSFVKLAMKSRYSLEELKKIADFKNKFDKEASFTIYGKEFLACQSAAALGEKSEEKDIGLFKLKINKSVFCDALKDFLDKFIKIIDNKYRYRVNGNINNNNIIDNESDYENEEYFSDEGNSYKIEKNNNIVKKKDFAKDDFFYVYRNFYE